MPKKVAINRCYGGFALSEEACKFLGTESTWRFFETHTREDPKLIECIETLGDKANGFCSKIKIVEIPDNFDYVIESYDGMEQIEENNKSIYY